MMNVRSLALAAVAALSALGTGCGSSNPLVGAWTEATSAGGETTQTTYDVNGDGTLSVTGSGTCSGTLTTTGLQWASTSSSITFSGTGACTGSVTCGALSFNCSGGQSSYAGSCTYAFSNNNDTLTLSGCSGTTDKTLIRAN